MVKRKAAPKGGETLKRKKAAQGERVLPNKTVEKAKQGHLMKEPRMTRSVAKASQQQSMKTSGNGVHPLLIDHILDKVFRYVMGPIETGGPSRMLNKCEDVKNIRKVCKQWNDAATRLFRRIRRPITFGFPNPNAIYWTTKLQGRDMRFEKFLDTMKNTQLIPVQRYNINTNFFIKQNQRLIKDFMRICGPDAIELRLHFDNHSTMHFTRRMFPGLNLGKLQKLIFLCEQFRGRSLSSQIHEIPCFVNVLLSTAENLQEFRFEFTSLGEDWHEGIVKRLVEVICKRIPKTVKILSLDLPLLDSDVENLIENNLKLNEFRFDCRELTEQNLIRNFFDKQTATLQVLKILNGLPYSSVPFQFPRFDRLQSLELQEANIESFYYPDTFPKLTTLNISEWKTESTCLELLSCSKKGVSIKEMYLPYRFPQAPLVKRAAQIFPNIKKLHVSPAPDIAESLPEVFVYFSNLEELYISFPFLLDNELNADSLLSGVSEQDCRRIIRQRDFDNVNLRVVQRRPSITNLTKLNKLVLEDSACDVLLTDFTAHFVFLKMTSLNELHTGRCRMSTRYVQQLRERLTLKLVEDEDSDFSSDDSSEISSDNDSLNEFGNEMDDEMQFIHFLGFAIR